MRSAAIHRKTAETEVQLKLTLEGKGRYQVSTGIRFLDHMLTLHAPWRIRFNAAGYR